MTKVIYETMVASFSLDTDEVPYLGIDVPEQLITDLNLKAGDKLRWEIDPTTQTAILTKI